MKSRVSLMSLLLVSLTMLMFPVYIKTDVVLGDEDEICIPSPTPLATPRPSPNPESRDLDLLPIFEAVSVADYGDCELPCWWGFRPGETTLDEIQHFLEETGFDRSWRESRYSEYPLDQYLRWGEVFILQFDWGRNFDGGNFWIAFDFDANDVLASMDIKFEGEDSWLSPETNPVTLPHMLSQGNDIPEIYVATDSLNQLFINNIALLLIDDEAGVMVSYHIDVLDVQPDPINWDAFTLRLCFGLAQTTYISIQLRSPDAEPAISHNVRDSINPEEGPGYHSLEEVFGIDTETFVQFFRDNPDECLDLSEYTDQ